MLEEDPTGARRNKLVSSSIPKYQKNTRELYELAIITLVWSHSSKYENTTKTIKNILHDPTKGMSSSLLDTFQTDWITGRSLATVFLSFALAVIAQRELSMRLSRLRRLHENEREWRRQDNWRIHGTTLTQSRYGQGNSILSHRSFSHLSSAWACLLRFSSHT